MEQESIYLNFFFMFFGLGFFIFMMIFANKILDHDNDRDYNRKLNEAREFGFKNSRLRKEATDTEPQSKN